MEKLTIKLIRKLYRLRKIVASHTLMENLPKGFPKHLRREIKDIVKDLIKEGFLLARKHNYGLGVSLNPERLDEIEKIIEEK